VKSTLEKLEELGAVKLAALVAAILGTGTWVFFQVRDINPAILQDEWIYSITARQHSPWDQNLAFDFGNYLFNFVYSSTNLCGQEFYTCTKLINILFLQGFALTLFVIALRFVPFWVAFGFFVAAALSPTSVYASMFLPEPMFFFFLGLTLYFVLKASEKPNWRTWAYAGSFLGLAGLAKPHALMAAMALGIYLLVASLDRRPYWKFTALNVVGFAGGFLVVRVLIGLIVAGPKSLNVFGAYGASGAIGKFVGGVVGGDGITEGELVGAGPVAGALGLFGSQSYTHSLVIAALLGAAVVAILVATVDIFTTREVRPQHRFALVALIWLVVMVIAIVLFTGWITGGGDDHTTRVLLRYYDYLFPIVMLAGLVVAWDKQILSNTKAWIRWIVIAPIFLLISVAFAGYFGSLTIQIADAPNLAGLVVDQTQLNVTANLMFLTLFVIAFFPKFTIWAIALVVPWTMIGTGWQIQDQYQGFRAEDSAADKAGFFTRDFIDPEDLDSVLILAESRFDGRVASFWMEHNTDLELLAPASVYPTSSIPADIKWVLSIGSVSVESGEVVSSEEGYTLVKVRD
jgi:phosphoglycerol transferase